MLPRTGLSRQFILARRWFSGGVGGLIALSVLSQRLTSSFESLPNVIVGLIALKSALFELIFLLLTLFAAPKIVKLVTPRLRAVTKFSGGQATALGFWTLICLFPTYRFAQVYARYKTAQLERASSEVIAIAVERFDNGKVNNALDLLRSCSKLWPDSECSTHAETIVSRQETAKTLRAVLSRMRDDSPSKGILLEDILILDRCTSCYNASLRELESHRAQLRAIYVAAAEAAFRKDIKSAKQNMDFIVERAPSFGDAHRFLQELSLPTETRERAPYFSALMRHDPNSFVAAVTGASYDPRPAAAVLGSGHAR